MRCPKCNWPVAISTMVFCPGTADVNEHTCVNCGTVYDGNWNIIYTLDKSEDNVVNSKGRDK